MFVCLKKETKKRTKKVSQEGHSIDDFRTTFGSTLASFVTEIFHECCPFGNTPLPLAEQKSNLKDKQSMAAKCDIYMDEDKLWNRTEVDTVARKNRYGKTY